MRKLIKEFKDFALKESFVSLVLGIVIGGSFIKIINSLVSDLIMPLMGVIIENIDFSSLHWTIKQFNTGNKIMIYYGAFIDAIVNFLIIIVVMFIVIKVINKLEKNKLKDLIKTTEKEEVILLREIRNSLRNKND